MSGKEFWSYMMENGAVYPLGEFSEDFDTAWSEIYAKATHVAKRYSTEPLYAVSETDLTEMSAHIQRCFNTMQNVQKQDYYLISVYVDASEVETLRRLVKQNPDCEALSSLLHQYGRDKRLTLPNY